VIPSSKHINLHPGREIVPPTRVCSKNFKEYVPFGFGNELENAFIRGWRGIGREVFQSLIDLFICPCFLEGCFVYSHLT